MATKRKKATDEQDEYAGYPEHYAAAWREGGCVLVNGQACAGPDDLPEGHVPVQPAEERPE